MRQQNHGNQNDRGNRGRPRQVDEDRTGRYEASPYRGGPEPDQEREWDDREEFPRRAAEPWPDQERDYEGGRSFGGEDRDYEMARRGYGHSYGSPPHETRGWEDQGQGQPGGRQAPGGMRRREEFVGKGPKGYTRSDERIKEAVSDRLSEGYLDASEIEVTVTNGEVTLVGFVPDKNSRRWAEDLVEGVSGVKDVENRLKLRREGAGAQTGQKFS
jgi:hypothetical protein